MTKSGWTAGRFHKLEPRAERQQRGPMSAKTPDHVPPVGGGHLARSGALRAWRAGRCQAKAMDEMTEIAAETHASARSRPKPRRGMYLDDQVCEMLSAEAKRRRTTPIELDQDVLAFVRRRSVRCGIDGG